MIAPPPPPHPSDLPYGTVLRAGLGLSEVIADIDSETYSEAGFVWNEAARKWQSLPDASQGKKGLPVVGAAVYAEHPTCDVRVQKYNLKDGRGPQHWRPGLPNPSDLFAHIARGGLIEAWNVGFEQWIWEHVCTPRYGWPVVPEGTWRCAMAKARAHCLPGGLDSAGEVLGLQVKKDKAGKALLARFSVPRNPTKADPRTIAPTLWTPEDCAREVALILPYATTKAAQRDAHLIIADDYERTQALDKYCAIDIQSEAEVSAAVPDLSPFELRTWQDDRRINRRGVRIDMAGVHDCIAVIKQAQHRYGAELHALAGCAPSEVAQLTRWLADQGLYMPSLDDEAITEALTRPLEPHVRRALEIRAAVASASVKKVFAMRNQATRHSRLHDLYTYHGARTGRPTGNGPQPTNLPKAGPMNHRCGYDYADRPLPSGGCGRYHGAHTMWCQWCGRFTLRGPKDAREWSPEAAEDALVSLTHRSLDWMEVLWGDALLAVAGVLRGLFIASPGCDFISSDFTAIEGVVVAAMAGEQWRVDAYEQSRPMYLLSAERMFGVSVEEMEAFARQTGKHHPLRQKGKGGELGLGFGGWVQALRQFGVDGTDEELKDTVLKWRGASPNIEWYWGGQRKGIADTIRKVPGADRWDRTEHYFGLEGAAVLAVLNPGEWRAVLRMDDTPTGVRYLCQNDVLYCQVPSGGLITYHRPRLEQSEQSWRGLSLSFEGWNTNPKNGPLGWVRMNTYSGRLAENVTQKVARDKQMCAIHRAESSQRYPVVLHTYDEIVGEADEGDGSVEELEALMVQSEAWCEGWPIKAAGGWRGKRYRKG